MEHTSGFHNYCKPQTGTCSAPAQNGFGFAREGPKLPDVNDNHNKNKNKNKNAIADDNECMVREQDRFMPIANVIRIMRKTLPSHAKISDDAKETIQECVSEYISFITSEANEQCQREQRKTITAEDVLLAMSKLGFDDYIGPLTVYLHRYRELEGERTSVRASPATTSAFQYNVNGYYGAPTTNANEQGVGYRHVRSGPSTPSASQGAFVSNCDHPFNQRN